MMLLVVNEYYFGERHGHHTRDGRPQFFPVNGFSVKLHGGYKDLYAYHIYAPNRPPIALAMPDKERNQESPYRIALVHDKGRWLRDSVGRAVNGWVEPVFRH